jgi:hypothetical protein
VRSGSAGRRRPSRGPGGVHGARLSAPGDWVVTRLVGGAALRELQQEALEQGGLAGTSFTDTVPPDGSGPPVHWLEAAEGGPALEAFLGSARGFSPARPAWPADGGASGGRAATPTTGSPTTSGRSTGACPTASCR